MIGLPGLRLLPMPLSRTVAPYPPARTPPASRRSTVTCTPGPFISVTGPAQRYERARPDELIHIDVKKLGRIQSGAGHRITAKQPRDVLANYLSFFHEHGVELPYPSALDQRLRRPRALERMRPCP
jgi:hypothetical protein